MIRVIYNPNWSGSAITLIMVGFIMVGFIMVGFVVGTCDMMRCGVLW